MNKKLVYLIFIVMASGFACLKQPTSPPGCVSFDLELVYNDQGANMSGIQPGLAKTNRIVEQRVLDLPFNTIINRVAGADTSKDISGFNHHALLYNIEPLSLSAANRGVSFSGENSYVVVPDNGDSGLFAGTQGLEITVSFSLFEGLENRDQVLVDKYSMGSGYVFGVRNGYPYLRVANLGNTVTLTADTLLYANTWYKFTAQFRPVKPYLFIGTKSDTSLTFEGGPPAVNEDMLIGAGHSGLLSRNNYLFGNIDHVSVNTTTVYEDFDKFRVAVMDVNRIINSDSLRDITPELMWYYLEENPGVIAYHRDKELLLHGSTAPVWANMRLLWDKYFRVLGENELVVRAGYAEGALNGMEGMNMIAVGGLRNGKIAWYGEGFAFGIKNRTVRVLINMSQIYTSSQETLP